MTDRAGLKILRCASFAAVPWKNGGGITREAIREPPTGDSFLWRVSVAHIDASGPFSDFAGYDRRMVLLQGQGIELQFAGGEARFLRSAGDCVEFDGAVSTHCELLDGPCVDLNLMVSKSLRSAARVECLSDGLAAAANRAETTLIFGIQDPLWVDCSVGEPARLEPWDLAILKDCSARLRKIGVEAGPGPSTVFIATISH
jgi:uncharacterized protein